MPYDRLRRRLPAGGSPALSTLPDGSIDHYCTLSAGAVGPIRSRAELGREMCREEHSSFRFRVQTTEPGGQAVNVAGQLYALGSDVACYGHLDAPVFEQLPFETVSMGDPAVVYAFDFEDGDVMFVRASTVARDWTLADLRAAADLADVFGVDAVCCSNWVSFPAMGEAFRRLGGMDLPRVPFVFDPGDVVGAAPDEIDALRDALGALQGTFDVVYNANRGEIRATAATLPDPPAADGERVAAIRVATGIEAVVMHAEEEAVVATGEGTRTVESLRVDSPARHTGGGDHFSGGLGYALAEGWDWDLALACGNACATHYVETGESATPEDLVAFVEERAPES